MTDPRSAVFAEKCDTCVFRPGNPMHLRPGALPEIVRSNLSTGTLLICHKTTYGQAPEEVACRGFFDAYGARVNVVRVMERLAAIYGYDGGFREVPVPEGKARP